LKVAPYNGQSIGKKGKAAAQPLGDGKLTTKAE
jgi:hypothetical protein